MLQRLVVEQETLEEQGRQAKERIETLSSRIEQLGQDIDRENSLNKDAEETIDVLSKEQDELQIALSTHSEKLEKVASDAQEASTILKDREINLSELTEDMARLAARHQSSARFMSDSENALSKNNKEAATMKVKVSETSSELERGWSLFQKLINYMRSRQDAAGYKEVNTPEVLDRQLWEKSGHWEKYGENMYTSETPDEKVFAIKPMNCPGHIQVFNQGLKSYRDLPLRFAEFGKVHRYEPSGALHGLLRVRAFTQDDAHIFCTEDQITSECLIVTNLILDIYKDLGFENVILKYADRPEVRVGDDSVWDKAEASLLEAVKASKLEYTINKGEGAFYGPKIEFVLRDVFGSECSVGWRAAGSVIRKKMQSVSAPCSVGGRTQDSHCVDAGRSVTM